MGKLIVSFVAASLSLFAQFPSISSAPAAASSGSSNALVTYSGKAATLAAGTYFLPFGGGAAPSATETDVENGVPVQGTVKNMYVEQSVAIGAGNTATYTMRKNGSDQAITCQITGATDLSCADNNNSFTIVGGDIITYSVVTTGTVSVTPNILVSVGLTSVVVPPSPSFSLVSSLAATSPTGNGFTSGAIDTSGATAIVVAVGEQGSPITFGVTDSKGNTYTPLTPTASTVNGQLFYCLNPIVGTGHTFSVTTSGATFPAIAVEAWNIAGTPTFSAQSGASALQPGAISAVGTSLFVTGVTFNPFTLGVTINSGFTISSQAPSTATAVGIGIAHIVSSATLNPTWAGPGGGASLMATFK